MAKDYVPGADIYSIGMTAGISAYTLELQYQTVRRIQRWWKLKKNPLSDFSAKVRRYGNRRQGELSAPYFSAPDPNVPDQNDMVLDSHSCFSSL